jgi:hypothetical protein
VLEPWIYIVLYCFRQFIYPSIEVLEHWIWTIGTEFVLGSCIFTDLLYRHAVHLSSMGCALLPRYRLIICVNICLHFCQFAFGNYFLQVKKIKLFCRTRHFSTRLGKKCLSTIICLHYLSSLNRSMHMPTVYYFHMLIFIWAPTVNLRFVLNAI